MFVTGVLGVELAGSEWHVALTLVGATAEIAGLSLIVWDAGRARRVEFGVLSWPRRFVRWVAAGTKMAHVSRTVQLSGTASGTASAAGVLTTVTSESQIDRMERQLRELRDRVDQVEREARLRHESLTTKLRAVAETAQSLVESYGQEQRELRRRSLRLEVVGARLFIVGALLSAAANLVA